MWLEKQVRAWADESMRLDVAVRMYEKRFQTVPPQGTTLAQLRGMEGQRMKALYRMLSDKHRIPRFRRNYDPAQWDSQDPVNLALSAANACMYGITYAAILALGCSPALGFIHSGTQHAFVYDIADLYKARVTIPLAFSLNSSSQPERDARVRLREEFRLLKILREIVTDIQALLDPDADVVDTEALDDIVHLWDPVSGPMPAGVNYADEIGDLPWPQ
jgi:CRISPR-associated protein Cas1